MKLLKLEAKGFKSFADKTIITFPEKITGVVGPNGCGKSNIADAIKWVFGEQSAKNLRGKSMEEIIFVGSESRRAQNFAEVKLLFDNSDRSFKMDFNQIEVVRRLYRGEGTNQYFINGQSVRLRDVQEFTMDTGLGKGTLALISQGTVSNFAEAKPQDRRQIFEEAAGVSKYKKRKIESIRKLDRTERNLERISDIVYELEKQYKPLKKQAQKAKKYLEINSKLKSKEITLLVYDISNIKSSLDKDLEKLKDYQQQDESFQTLIDQKQKQTQSKKDLIYEIDLKLNKLQVEVINLSKITNQAAKLEDIILYQKNELTKSDDPTKRIEQLSNLLPNILNEINLNQKQIAEIDKTITENNASITSRKEDITKTQEILVSIQQKLNKLEVNKNITQNNIRKNAHLPFGVQKLLENKKSFIGLIDIVKEQIKPQEGFELAIAAALGRQKDSVIVKDKYVAKKSLEFLKNNKLGRATLLPLDTIKAKSFKQDIDVIVDTVSGCLGKAIDFVDFDMEITPATKFILGNVLIAKNLDFANEISYLTNKKYRIVTLDGQIVNAGGSITGGHSFAINSKANLEKLFKQLSDEINTIETKKEKLILEVNTAQKDIDNLNLKANSLNSKQAKTKALLEAQSAKFTLWANEYKSLSGKDFDFKSQDQNQILNDYSLNMQKLDFAKDEIKSLTNQKDQILTEWKKLDDNLSLQKNELQGIKNVIHQIELKKTKDEINLETLTTRLVHQYELTFDFALEKFNDFSNIDSDREIVNELKSEINKLGFINLDAIELIVEIEERYLTMKAQKEELESAKDTILSAVSEMDKKMINDFDKTFKEINIHFQDSFKKLFGGGKAKLEYSDPSDILESGIEVKVQPPGKSITNLNLFSGGEKSLIAISVLFAILKTKPIPLCVLDEVEAPLDQVNIERFGDYLHEFSDLTQFVVITHRAGTMLKCNNLYGVTMQEQGVSKIVSVNLTQAQSMSENNQN